MENSHRLAGANTVARHSQMRLALELKHTNFCAWLHTNMHRAHTESQGSKETFSPKKYNTASS